MAEMKSAPKSENKGFTEDERAAMKERAQELKAEARKADGESALRAKIAEMKRTDRDMAERIHAIVTASAPDLSPKTWYGIPHARRTARSSASSKARRSSSRDMRRLASATKRTSTKERCGRPPSH